MKIAVLGTGAVGGYFGGRLLDAGHDVTFIARGRQRRALQRQGLEVVSPLGDLALDVTVVEDARRVGPCDLVLICVKAYDTPAVADLLPPLIRREGVALSLQNGIGNEDELVAAVGADRVLGGVCYIASQVRKPGVIVHEGGPARIVFGELGGGSSARTAELETVFRDARIDADGVGDVQAAMWNKLAFICAHAGMTATTRSPIGRIREIPEAWAMFRALSAEACAVARAEGVALGAEVPQEHQRLASSFEPTARSSLHDDLVHGRRLELEALHGEVVRRAARHRVPVPMTEAVYAILKPSESGVRS